MVISECDLGVKTFEASKANEELDDFCQIMNIPIQIKKDQDHPSLNENVYKKSEFQEHAELNHMIHHIVHDPQLHFMEHIVS